MFCIWWMLRVRLDSGGNPFAPATVLVLAKNGRWGRTRVTNTINDWTPTRDTRPCRMGRSVVDSSGLFGISAKEFLGGGERHEQKENRRMAHHLGDRRFGASEAAAASLGP